MDDTIQKFLIASLIAVGMVSWTPAFASTAVGTLRVTPGTIYVGDQLTVEVWLETGDAAANAVDVSVRSNPTMVRFVKADVSTSVLTVWVQPPTVTGNGEIHFIGGLPRPGWTGKRRLATLAYRALRAGSTPLAFSASQVLLNDGKGTALPVAWQGAVVVISPAARSEPGVLPPTPELPPITVQPPTVVPVARDRHQLAMAEVRLKEWELESLLSLPVPRRPSWVPFAAAFLFVDSILSTILFMIRVNRRRRMEVDR